MAVTMTSIRLDTDLADEAVKVLRPAESEKDEQVLVLLALALKQTSAYANALVAVNRALNLHPDDAQALQIKREILVLAKHD